MWQVLQGPQDQMVLLDHQGQKEIQAQLDSPERKDRLAIQAHQEAKDFRDFRAQLE